jgi:hypothetical protein
MEMTKKNLLINRLLTKYLNPKTLCFKNKLRSIILNNKKTNKPNKNNNNNNPEKSLLLKKPLKLIENMIVLPLRMILFEKKANILNDFLVLFQPYNIERIKIMFFKNRGKT